MKLGQGVSIIFPLLSISLITGSPKDQEIILFYPFPLNKSSATESLLKEYGLVVLLSCGFVENIFTVLSVSDIRYRTNAVPDFFFAV